MVNKNVSEQSSVKRVLVKNKLHNKCPRTTNKKHL